MTRVAVTGWSVHLPDARSHAALPDIGSACPPHEAAVLLGRKGLLMKEPATRLALCAVHRALGLGPGERVGYPTRTDTAVVASSNLGNVETVVKITKTVAAHGRRAISPMDAPNASSNVLAGTVAMWFRFGGPNLMVCAGLSSGFDAVRLAVLLLCSGRASRVVVVGAEPDDPVATGIHARGCPRAPLRAGAACVILERCDGERERGDGHLVLELVRDGGPWPPGILIGSGGLDPLAVWGDCYGAQGVLEVALAALIASARGEPVRAACGGGPAGRVVLQPVDAP